MGRVTAYNPTEYSAKVVILPEGDFTDKPGAGETGWLPIDTAWAGNGWGMYAPPTIGHRVTVEHVEGDTGSGIITGCVYDLQNVPLSVQSGEFWLVHKKGQFIKLTNDGNVSISSSFEVAITASTIKLTAASVRASENLSVGNGASGTFTAASGETVTVLDGIITNIF